jgi:RNA polymerase sigma-54 factor
MLLQWNVSHLQPPGTVRLTLSQEQRQEQRQIMTQRLIQSMEILQLTLLQLEQRIDRELEQNPVLELSSEPSAESRERSNDTDSDNDYSIEDDSFASEEHEPEIQFEHAVEHTGDTEEFSIAEEFSLNYADTIDEAPVRSQNWLEEQEILRADVFANAACPGESLQTHLEQQLDWFDISEPLRDMTLRIINNLEPSGYFTYVWEDFLGENHTYEELEIAREALALVKRLEPAGVGGKDLRECLLLQIDPHSEYAEVLRILITSCLEDIAANRIPLIAKKIEFPLEVVQEAVAELRHFHPRPGTAFRGSTAPVVIPEISVERLESGRYIVHLEEGRSSQLRISKFYKDQIAKYEADKVTRAYIKKKIGAAQWLLNAVAQRRETLLKVSQAIVDHQTEFFEKGPQALKPLKMQQIADRVGLHVTTVSRACDEKWVSSPQGVFPLRRLFAGKVTMADGEGTVANDVVRSKIQELIDQEDKTEPWSDDAIVKMLESEGIQVARRTIVKYRRLLGIPNSRGRRQWTP